MRGGPSLFPETAAFPVEQPGRLPHRLFGACPAFPHVAAYLLAEPSEAARGLDGFVSSVAAPRVTGWSDQLPGGNRTR